ncbi:uncharacterized protein LACBIDRAFT_296130 [Laccaria bicolor S238N-H82]|uniref:Predicted protein n=1 Tax=Laccaria bicolor (strain S238N-H82 / ATCC MYA-4686) TaxID=486041 RepID=B0E2W4_LACBS|nr:uncharacterized protein LACBIDRAFT_296130 [Laccaria bicolor S238N-H82]EDQ98822.1 predicted protein [Laccaria bicolor S238N-H82]|eukprot:XP_001890532.1 predicted protein [Laccaria bicolor S238N-H82]
MTRLATPSRGPRPPSKLSTSIKQRMVSFPGPSILSKLRAGTVSSTSNQEGSSITTGKWRVSITTLRNK